MSIENEKLMERLKKLYTLSKRGVGGEANNAKSILDNLLKKHGISIESLMDIEKKRYYFTPKTKMEQNILFTIITQVLESANVEWYARKKSRKLGFDLTPYHYAEIQIQYDGYVKAWQKYQKQSEKAFIHANKLYYYDDGSKKQKEDKPLTQEELAELFNIIAMMKGVPQPTFSRGYLQQA